MGAEEVRGKMAKEIVSDELWAVIQPLMLRASNKTFLGEI